MNDWKIIPTIVLSTALIFGAGVVIGGLLVNFVKPTHSSSGVGGKKNQPGVSATTNGFANSSAKSSLSNSSARTPEILSKPFLQQLDTELHLTPDEHEAIQKIMNDGQNQIRKVVQDSRLEIREVLTPEQLKEFDALVKRPFKRPLFPTNTPATTNSN